MSMVSDRESAVNAGFTREVSLECDCFVLSLLVRPDCDLEGEFTAFCLDECELLTVNGWLFDALEGGVA